MKRRKMLSGIFKFLFVNLLFSVAIGYRYLPDVTGIVSTVFVWVSLIGNTFMLYLPLFLLNAIVVIFLPFRKLNMIINVVLIFLFQLVLFIDTVVYAIYNFHINGAVISIFTSGGFGDSVELGALTTVLAVAFVVVAIIVEVILFKIFVKFSKVNSYKKSFKISRLFLLGLLFLVADKAIYAVADLYNQTSVIRFVKLFPLYQPLTIKSFMHKTFGFEIDREDEIKISTKNKMLNYPKNSIVYDENVQSKPNILVIFFDGWRYDMFTPEVTPNVWEFGKKSTVFANHYSGGNASRFGVFSLFYGVSGYYWHKILGERRSCVLIDELQKLDYDFYISASTRLTYPEFRKTCFINIPEYIYDTIPGKDVTEKDPKLAQGFIDYLKKKKREKTSKPFFSFLFFDAPHGSNYPDKYEKFTPTQKSVNYVKIDDEKENVDMMRNAYKNTIVFDDALAGDILKTLKSGGYLENTIVIISADHGQEFYENGFFGHCSAFDKYQTKVPFVVHWPNKPSGKIEKMTSHLDFVPSVLEELGVRNPASDYSQGMSLWNGNGHKFVQSSGWDDAALIYPDYYFVFSIETYKAGLFEVRDKDYALVKDDKKIISEKRKDLLNTIKGFSEFSK